MGIAAESMSYDSDPETLVALAKGGDREAFDGLARKWGCGRRVPYSGPHTGSAPASITTPLEVVSQGGRLREARLRMDHP